MFDTVVDSPKLDCQILNLHWWACVRSREQDCVTLAGSFLSYHLWETRSYAGCASEMMLRYIFSIVLIMLLLVSNMFYFSIDWEYHHPNWRTHIFQRGRSTTNQVSLLQGKCSILKHQPPIASSLLKVPSAAPGATPGLSSSTIPVSSDNMQIPECLGIFRTKTRHMGMDQYLLIY